LVHHLDFGQVWSRCLRNDVDYPLRVECVHGSAAHRDDTGTARSIASQVHRLTRKEGKLQVLHAEARNSRDRIPWMLAFERPKIQPSTTTQRTRDIRTTYGSALAFPTGPGRGKRLHREKSAKRP